MLLWSYRERERAATSTIFKMAIANLDGIDNGLFNVCFIHAPNTKSQYGHVETIVDFQCGYSVLAESIIHCCFATCLPLFSFHSISNKQSPFLASGAYDFYSIVRCMQPREFLMCFIYRHCTHARTNRCMQAITEIVVK